MARNMFVGLFLVLVLECSHHAHAGDPDLTSDFLQPSDGAAVNASYFTFSGFNAVLNSDSAPPAFKVTKASMAEFPALNGQSVSYAVLQYPAGAVNPLHIHPRAAELLLVIQGCLEVGFVDTANKLFTQTLKIGDMFVFPKGLVHFQYNPDSYNQAVAISSFGSASAGTVSLPLNLFNTSIDDGILALSFKTDVPTIQKIKSGFLTTY